MKGPLLVNLVIMIQRHQKECMLTEDQVMLGISTNFLESHLITHHELSD